MVGVAEGTGSEAVVGQLLVDSLMQTSFNICGLSCTSHFGKVKQE